MGMVEKAMFLAEFQNINNSGQVKIETCIRFNLMICLQATEGLILAAEVVSSGKRTLARM